MERKGGGGGRGRGPEEGDGEGTEDRRVSAELRRLGGARRVNRPRLRPPFAPARPAAPAPSPVDVSAAIEIALEAALSAALDPPLPSAVEPALTVRDALAASGLAEEQVRVLVLTACHAYEAVLRRRRRGWEASGLEGG